MRQVNARQNEDDEHGQIRLINNRIRISIRDQYSAIHRGRGLFETTVPNPA